MLDSAHGWSTLDVQTGWNKELERWHRKGAGHCPGCQEWAQPHRAPGAFGHHSGMQSWDIWAGTEGALGWMILVDPFNLRTFYV